MSEKASGCIFCAAAAGDDDDASLVVYRGRKVFVLLNRYPYTNGHVMIAPYAHEKNLSASNAETLGELIQTMAHAERILSDAYQTDGLNVGINLGSAAGAGIADHYHVHVVPRWKGDTNFMTVAAGVRVVPEELAVTRRKLAPLFARAAA
ncbi:MAG TPA: HIT domain-containing protein [Thermoanaerobaculia bacterium]